MALPDREVAQSWVGRTVVDRDGTAIGACAALFADDDTGLLEWLAVQVGDDTTALVPALDAHESEGQVRVTVALNAVLTAPFMNVSGHLPKEREATLYQHYDIPYSAAGSVLPEGEASEPPPASEQPTPAAAMPPPATEPRPEPMVTEPPRAEPTISTIGSYGGESGAGFDVRRLAAPLLGALGGLALVAGAILGVRRLRRRRQETPADRLARQLREARDALLDRTGQVATNAGPMLRDSRQIGARAAQAAAAATRTGIAAAGTTAVAKAPVVVATASDVGRLAADRARVEAARLAARLGSETADRTADARRMAADRAAEAGRLAAERAAEAARVATERATEAGRAAAERAAEAGRVAGERAQQVAGTLTTTVVPAVTAAAGKAVEGVSDLTAEVQQTSRSVLTKTMLLLGLAVGYLLGARAGRERYEEIKERATEIAERPDVQHARERLQTLVQETLGTGGRSQ